MLPRALLIMYVYVQFVDAQVPQEISKTYILHCASIGFIRDSKCNSRIVKVTNVTVLVFHIRLQRDHDSRYVNNIGGICKITSTVLVSCYINTKRTRS
jgi:hypothetical protein